MTLTSVRTSTSAPIEQLRMEKELREHGMRATLMQLVTAEASGDVEIKNQRPPVEKKSFSSWVDVQHPQLPKFFG